MKKLLIVIAFILALFQVNTWAQDFVYQPINPVFGGSPYNYDWLLGQAQAQNTYQEEDGYRYEDEDPLAGLQDDINRQVLNSLTLQFYQNQFGEAGLTEGYYKFGSYEIDISAMEEGMQVRIIDIYTGNEPTIITPYY